MRDLATQQWESRATDRALGAEAGPERPKLRGEEAAPSSLLGGAGPAPGFGRARARRAGPERPHPCPRAAQTEDRNFS